VTADHVEAVHPVVVATEEDWSSLGHDLPLCRADVMTIDLTHAAPITALIEWRWLGLRLYLYLLG
jgi:hypothetical protein